MSFLAGLLTLVSFLAPLAALAYTWYRCHRRLHAKGYSRFFITIAFLGILIGCFWLLSRFGNDVVTLFGSPLLWIGLALLLTRVLLARPGSRRAGKRQAVGASVWGWVVTALGSAMGTVSGNIDADFLADIKVACIPVVVAALANAVLDVEGTATASLSILGTVGG